MKNYGHTSDGEEITESMVDEFYRIAEQEILPKHEIYMLCDTYCSIDEDSFQYFNTNTAFGAILSFTLNATFRFDTDITRYDFFSQDTWADIETRIIVENNEIVDIIVDDIIVYHGVDYSDFEKSLKMIINVESFKETVRKLAEPAIAEMACVLSNI